jgi:hypothetical protein
MNRDTVNMFYSFIPQAWSGVVPLTNKNTEKYAIYWSFKFTEYEDYKITLRLEVGNFEERGDLIDLLAEAATANKDIKLNVRKGSNTFTRIFSEAIPLKGGNNEYDLEDYESITEKLIEVYNSKSVQQVLSVVDGVVQGFQFKSV